MSSDLIIQIVGHKADLAPTHRKIELEHAKNQISKWIQEAPAPGDDSSAPQSSLILMGKRPAPPSTGKKEEPASSTLGGLSGFSLSRSTSRRRKSNEEASASASKVPQLPVWKDIGISEVSAKEDEGIEDLFLTIASKLVERKVQIEHDRILRTKDSIMISDEDGRGSGNVDDPTRVWGCC